VPDTPLDISPRSRALVKREAGLLFGIVGSLREDKTYIRDGTSAVLLARDWGEGHARIYACWVAGARAGVGDVQGEHLVTVK
jgi:telomere length regulation protein